MAERRFERDLRAMLAQDLDAVHGPHPRWADAPVALRVVSGQATPSRWRTAALLVAASVGLVVLAIAVGIAPREAPVATPPPSIEPWPSAISPSATPTTGEIALGRVAVATADGTPILLVRVSPAATRAADGVGVRIEMRVVGRLDRAVGIDRFLVVRGGRAEAPGLGVTGPDPLAIPADAPVGTEVAATVPIPAGPDEDVYLGFAAGGSSVTFRYRIHRTPLAPSVEGRCPTLEDYAIASLQPSAEPASPSFGPVAPGATPSTGMLALGDTGILAAPDGSPGALVRISNARFCDRLPDIRPDTSFTGGERGTLLLADVEITVLEPGTIPVFIPGTGPVRASYAGLPLYPVRAWGMPGDNGMTASGSRMFTYQGTMVWNVPAGDGQVAVEVQRPGGTGDTPGLAVFSFLVRDGFVGPPWPQSTPAPTSDPAATPTSGTSRPGEQVILAAEGGTMPVVVDRIDPVARYPGVAPAVSGNVFVEWSLSFGPGSGAFGFEPGEWVAVGPDGATLARLERPDPNEYPPGWPQFLLTLGSYRLDPGFVQPPLWFVVDAPASGQVTLEYRPAGGPALVTWVLRETPVAPTRPASGTGVLVATGGEPALLARVSPAATRGLDTVGVTIELRVVGRLDLAVGIDRFFVVRDGTSEAPGLGVTGGDPLAIPAGASVGTQVATTVLIPAGPDENVDLAFAGPIASMTYRYPIHRASPPPTLEGSCPTLEDYAQASLQPSTDPARPSFEPVAPGATPSTGFLPLGSTGIVTAPDGSPGALVRVTNARFCDRLPDQRAVAVFGEEGTFLLADVEIEVLATGAFEYFIPGAGPVVGTWMGFAATSVPAWGMPGADSTTSIEPRARFAYRGTMVWSIPAGDGQVAVEVRQPGADDAGPITLFSYLVRDGLAGGPFDQGPTEWGDPIRTSDPGAAPTSGSARLGEHVILAAEAGTMPVVVGEIEQVARYTGVAPAVAGHVFLEFLLDFGPGSGTFRFEPDEWIVVGPDGAALERLERPDPNDFQAGWPSFLSTLESDLVRPGIPRPRIWMIADAPASGQVTLEYRPAGGPALVTWVLRER